MTSRSRADNQEREPGRGQLTPRRPPNGKTREMGDWCREPSTLVPDGAYPLHMTAMRWICVGMGVVLMGCGSTQKEAEEPEPGYSDVFEEPGYDEVAQDDVTPGVAEEEEPAEEVESVSEPEFTDGMSVEEAINAVPQGVPRVNMEMDELARPLANPAAYDPCKPAASQHFTVKVAVWDGRAVGVDVKTTPNNPQLAECVARVVRGFEWDDRVKSLNTVEYAF